MSPKKSTPHRSEAAASELAAELRPPLLRLTRVIRNQRVDSSVTLTQLSAMHTLETRGPMSAGELACQESVQPPSMTKIIAGLEEHGLIQRTPHPDDRRQAILQVTGAGRELLEVERRSRTFWLSQRLAELSAAERHTLREAIPILDKLAEQ